MAATTPDDPQRITDPGPSPIAVVAVTTIVQALATLCTVIPAAIAPELARALGVPASLIGIQVSLVYFGAMVSSAVGGLPVRRWGALRTSQVSLALAALGVALMGVPSLPVVAAGSVVVGLGYGLTNPASGHLLMKVTRPESRNLVFSLKQTGVPLGGIAAGLAAPPLALAFGWQWAMAAGAGVTLGFLALIQPVRRAWDADRDPAATLGRDLSEDLSMVWRHRSLRRMSMAAFCYSAVQVSLTTFAVTMLVEDIHFGLVKAGIVFSVLQVAGVAGRVIWGGAADAIRDGNRILVLIALIAAVASALTVLLSASSPAPVIYGVLALFGFSAIGWNGVFLAEIARLAPPGRIGNATGIVMVPTFGGVLIGPASFTGLYALTGAYTATFGVFALVSLCGLALVSSARRGMADD